SSIPPSRIPHEPIRTRTMARLLSSQGHLDRARAIYDELVELTPGDPELLDERRALESMPPPTDRAARSGPTPEAITAVCIDGTSLLIHWSVSEAGIERARQVLGRPGTLVARV